MQMQINSTDSVANPIGHDSPSKRRRIQLQKEAAGGRTLDDGQLERVEKSASLRVIPAVTDEAGHPEVDASAVTINVEHVAEPTTEQPDVASPRQIGGDSGWSGATALDACGLENCYMIDTTAESGEPGRNACLESDPLATANLCQEAILDPFIDGPEKLEFDIEDRTDVRVKSEGQHV